MKAVDKEVLLSTTTADFTFCPHYLQSSTPQISFIKKKNFIYTKRQKSKKKIKKFEDNMFNHLPI